MNTKEKILNASMNEFAKTGYLGTSTKAIANAAGVAEMTLFRKFESKKNLFETMVKRTLGRELQDTKEINFNLSFYDFTKMILHQRLIVVSKHLSLVRMIIQESLQGRLTDNLNYIEIMSDKLHNVFEQYQSRHPGVDGNISLHLSGIVLHYAILYPSFNYFQLSPEKQHEFITKCLAQLKLT